MALYDEAAIPEQGKAPTPISPPTGTHERLQSPVESEAIDGGSGVPLLEVARTQPFMRNFLRCAHDRFPSVQKPETRVRKMIEEHPYWYRVCWWSDFGLLVLACALLFAVAVVVLYKSVWL